MFFLTLPLFAIGAHAPAQTVALPSRFSLVSTRDGNSLARCIADKIPNAVVVKQSEYRVLITLTDFAGARHRWALAPNLDGGTNLTLSSADPQGGYQGTVEACAVIP